ncbi:MAG: serine hydrolase [Bryobacteraceae bacterium]
MLNRRHFMRLGATGLAAARLLPRLGRAAESRFDSHGRRRVPSLVHKLLSTPVAGFPTITPLFAASFVAGTGPISLVRTETWSDFVAQVDGMAAQNMLLSCYTTIQSMNRTWFYGAFQPGEGTAFLIQTADPDEFQQAFTNNQGTMNLVDFNICWQLGQLMYSGYWLASATPKNQTLVWDLNFNDLVNQWQSLSATNNRMTRIQAYPQLDVTFYTALFEQGDGAYVFYDEPTIHFAADVNGQFSAETVVGLSFDTTSGNMAGCWRDHISPSQFVIDQDWDTLAATAQQAASSGMILQAMTAYPDAPSFDDYFEANLEPFSMGYAYAVANNGNIIANGAGYARSPLEAQNPGTPFTGDTRLNLASVSKAITGITLEVLLQQNPQITLDSPFWPLIQTMAPNPDPSIKVVTLRNLATMMSGMVQEPNEGPISPPNGDFWGYLNSYLSQPLVGTPGVTYYYDNTNFSILEGVIEVVSGMDYVAFATQYVLTPAGIDPTILSATPDPQSNAALTYSGPDDTRPGYYWGPIGFVGPAGWISSARELVRILMALRGASVLPSAVVSEMLNDGIGWYTNVGNFGTYYQHNGSIGNGLTPPQRLNTALVRLGEGYDIALLSDSIAPSDVVNLCISAFESRGIPASQLPPNTVSITSVVHAASFLPTAAPGAYIAVIGSGFPNPAQDWSAAIGNGETLPQELNGVEVRVGNQFAYVEYVSPTQVNALLPRNTVTGLASVQVTTPAGGFTASLQIDAIAPGLFAYQLTGTLYAAALFAGSTEYVAAAGALPGYTSRPAKAGDSVELFGTGMGPTNPPAPDGVVFTTSYETANPSSFAATLGGQPAQVLWAGLVGAGLYQVNIVIPGGLTGGDQPLVVTVGGLTTQASVMLTVQA